MKKIKQYKVGDIILRLEKNKMTFNAPYGAKAPTKIIWAMMVLGRYLKWFSIRDMYEKIRENIPPVTCSKSGRTLYIGYKPVMKICSTGNSDWAEMSRWQLIGAIDDMLENRNYSIVPKDSLKVVTMLEAKRIEDFILLTEEEYNKSKKLLREFLLEHCKEEGEYRFPLKEFKEETALPNVDLINGILHTKFLSFRGNGIELYSSLANENEDEVWLKFIRARAH